jgi:Cd2+/Zn2+-exporting ATPase
LGNERLCEELAVRTPEVRAALKDFEEAGQTAVILASERDVLWRAGNRGSDSREAPDAVRSLRALGIRKTLMLMGDNEGTARAIATQLAIDEYHLLPEEKVTVVEALDESGERVVFVGHGVNDAPALAAASVGVAMGAAGTDVALETADIALMADDLSKLPVAMRFSRRTLRIIKQNIAFSLVNKALFIVLAVGGWATLWMAVGSDMGASLVVILKGLQLRAERGAG